jgi:hypothetical protein
LVNTPAASDRPGAGVADVILRALPPGVTPTGWCYKPIHRHVLDNAPDVVDATRDSISKTFGDTPHVVVELRSVDLDRSIDSEILQALDRTDGGVLVVGIGYEQVDPSS